MREIFPALHRGGGKDGLALQLLKGKKAKSPKKNKLTKKAAKKLCKKVKKKKACKNKKSGAKDYCTWSKKKGCRTK